LTKSSKQQITRRTLRESSDEASGETPFCKERKGKFGDEACGHLEKTSGWMA
jgi:hypothetical protein